MFYRIWSRTSDCGNFEPVNAKWLWLIEAGKAEKVNEHAARHAPNSIHAEEGEL